jgi:hypothetical protein
MAEREKQKSPRIGLTVGAVALAFVFYPMTIAPTGSLSNGGALGIVSLAGASVMAWYAFSCNRVNRALRVTVQLPLTAVVTFMAIAEAVTQYWSGHWLWL